MTPTATKTPKSAGGGMMYAGGSRTFDEAGRRQTLLNDGGRMHAGGSATFDETGGGQQLIGSPTANPPAQSAQTNVAASPPGSPVTRSGGLMPSITTPAGALPPGATTGPKGGAVNPANFSAFDASVLGDANITAGQHQAYDPSVLGQRFQADQGAYDNFTNSAYKQATRTLDPYYDRLRKDFEQTAVNKGLAPNTEGYNTAFDQFMRQQNDAYSNAAFGAMQYGASRLDADRSAFEQARQYDASHMEQGRQFDNSHLENQRQADNSLGEQQRQFDAGLRESGRVTDNSFLENQRQFDKSDATKRTIAGNQLAASMASAAASRASAAAMREEQARQFDLTFGEDTRRWDLNFGEDNRRYDQGFGLQELTTMEGIADGYRDDEYRDAVFNAQQDQQQFNNLYMMMGLTPNANPQPVNAASAYNGQMYADMYNNNQQNDMYAGLANSMAQLYKNGWFGGDNTGGTASTTGLAGPRSF